MQQSVFRSTGYRHRIVLARQHKTVLLLSWFNRSRITVPSRPCASGDLGIVHCAAIAHNAFWRDFSSHLGARSVKSAGLISRSLDFRLWARLPCPACCFRRMMADSSTSDSKQTSAFGERGASHLSHWPGLRVKPFATTAVARGTPQRGHGIISLHCVTARRQPPSFWQ